MNNNLNKIDETNIILLKTFICNNIIHLDKKQKQDLLLLLKPQIEIKYIIKTAAGTCINLNKLTDNIIHIIYHFIKNKLL